MLHVFKRCLRGIVGAQDLEGEALSLECTGLPRMTCFFTELPCMPSCSYTGLPCMSCSFTQVHRASVHVLLFHRASVHALRFHRASVYVLLFHSSAQGLRACPPQGEPLALAQWISMAGILNLLYTSPGLLCPR